jgi:Pyruvate/2-oxoacid:ferredoxin oxidoreductase delta subunit
MKKYKKVILYYFTGTGNALKACRWFCQEAERKNIRAKMYPIDNNYQANRDELDDQTLIGFLSPTHGFNIAPAMLKFIVKFPAGIKADVFVLNTRGGLKVFKFFTPGISGSAQFLPMIILKLKGYNIKGGLPLDMPSNWLFLHPGLSGAKVKSILQRCERITKEFALNILKGKKIFRKMLGSLLFDIAILPITFMYYIYARFLLAKTMIYTSNCNNCKICADNCPVKAIKIVKNRPYWSYACEGCMRCINNCPLSSIQCSHLVFLITLIIPGWLANHFLFKYIQLPGFLNHAVILSILKMAFTLVLLFIMYAVIQRFLKYPYVGNFFKYTSFTTYWRRYRAPGISLKDFVTEQGDDMHIKKGV